MSASLIGRFGSSVFLEADLKQFSVTARRAPQRVRAANLANERAQLSRDLRSSDRVSRSPAPVRPKANPVPADDRFRSDDRNRAQDGRKPVIEPNEQKTIGIVQSWSRWQPSPKNVDLLPQGQIFRFYRRSRPKERSQEAKNQLKQVGHRVASLSRSFPASTLNRIFGTHTDPTADSIEPPVAGGKPADGTGDPAPPSPPPADDGGDKIAHFERRTRHGGD